MSGLCSECGATVPEGGVCRDNFHELLLLESRVPGVAGGLPHFYAVGAYVLQHPESMNFTAESLQGLRIVIDDLLEERATLEATRRRIRQHTNGPKRVTRRAGDPAPRWTVVSWPTTVADILAGGVEGYADRVTAWARSVRDALAAVGRP
jgi:hypothetical protein